LGFLKGLCEGGILTGGRKGGYFTHFLGAFWNRGYFGEEINTQGGAKKRCFISRGKRRVYKNSWGQTIFWEKFMVTGFPTPI